MTLPLLKASRMFVDSAFRASHVFYINFGVMFRKTCVFSPQPDCAVHFTLEDVPSRLGEISVKCSRFSHHAIP